MTQEQKAKAYDEALKCAEMYYKENKDYNAGFLPIIFPQLKESEDERIGNVIYCIVRDNKEVKRILEGNGVSVDNALAYLENQKNLISYYEDKLDRCACENLDKGIKAVLNHPEEYGLEKQKEQKPKNILTDDDSLQTAYLKGQTDVLEDPEAYGLQKEQKPADIVKPKFKVGDTIVSKDCQYEDEVIAVQNGAYKLKNLGELYLPEDEWELKDAPISGYELIDKMEHKSINRNELTWKDINELEEIMNEVRSDYRGGGIGQKNFGLEVLERFHYIKGDELDIKEQKPAEWSSKGRRGRIGSTPEHIRKKAENFLSKMEPPYDADDICSAYETGAMESTKLEWSEKDEKIRQKLIRFISSPNMEGFMLASDEQMFVSWLKSLRPMPKVAVADGTLWKPSEEQMKALEDAFRKDGSDEYRRTINSLYQDLKKL